MNDQLIKDYQDIKNRIAKLEADKIKAQTELDLKSKELSNIIDQLKELGINDLDKIEEVVEEKRKAFEDQLTALKEKLDNVHGA